MEINKTLISPSILSANFTNIASAIHSIEESLADWIHLDVMDGQFVPPITFGHQMVADIRPLTSLPLDVHLMIEKPENHIDLFINAGANYITVHSCSTIHLHRIITKIKESGVKAGVSIVPSTPVQSLEAILPYIDLVLIMSVNPGYGGQSFISNSFDKIAWLKEKRSKNNYSYLISIDGGVCEKNANKIKESGADVLISGSAFFLAEDKKDFVKRLKES